MTLSNAKSYILTAAGATPADIFGALEAHFTSAPAFWRVAPGVTNTAGESLCLELKAPFSGIVTVDPHVVIRRTASTWNVSLDPSKLVTDAGDLTTAPTTTSLNYSGEAFTAATQPTGLSDKILVTELEDMVQIFVVNAAKTFTPWGCQVGEVFRPYHDGYVSAGVDGLGVLSGAPNHSSSGVAGTWTSTNPRSLAKFGSVSSRWHAPALPSAISVFLAAQWDPADDGVNVRLPNPLPVEAQNIAGTTTDLTFGACKYVAMYPANVGTFAPLTLVDNGTQAWVFALNSSSPTSFIYPWEAGVPLVL